QSFIPDERYFVAWNSPAWSISTEFGFYLAFPALLIAIGRTWHWKLALCTAVLVSLLALGVDPRFLSVSPPARLAEFSAGMAAWVIWDRYVRDVEFSVAAWTALELAVVVGAVAWLIFCPLTVPLVGAHYSSALIHPFFAVPAPILLIAVASGSGMVGQFLSQGWLVYLGQISFAMYLFHFPLINLIGT